MADVIFAGVAVMSVVPDRRIERCVAQSGESDRYQPR
jgi:hypothetical protein